MCLLSCEWYAVDYCEACTDWPAVCVFQMKPLSANELSEMKAWYNRSRSITKMEYVNVDFLLGSNFSFDEYVKIVTESREQLYWFGPEVEVPLIIAYLLIMIFGIFANGLLCYTVVRKKKLRTVRNMFIMNLAVSDIIMCVLCMPFTLIKLLLKNWPLGEALCRIVPWMQAVNVLASTLTITAIAVDRYQVIVCSTTIKDTTKKWGAAFVILAIWFCSVLVGLPLLVYSRLEQKEYIRFVTYAMCLEDWPSDVSRLVYAAVIMLLQFVIPVIILIVIHWRICNFLKTRILANPSTPMEMKRAMKEAQRHRKNSTLLMAIAVMFALCWFPLTLLNLMADFNYFMFMYKNFLLAFAVAHLVAMVSACLNPIVYGWFNSNFRREFSRIICFWRDDLFDLEQKQLMQMELPQGPPVQAQTVVYRKTVSYKAIQTEVQPVFMRQDSPYRDSMELITSGSNSQSITR